MKTILLTTYAVNPYKGSEDGMGWNMITQIAKHHKVIAITRENNQPHIDKYLSEFEVESADNIQFEYFDLPYWMRFWKKGGRGALLYFYLWQFGIVYFIRRKKLKFDIAHNLNFHNDWTPSFLWRLGKPFVWGPVGHHPKIPKDYLTKFYGQKTYWMDSLKWWVKWYFWKISPMVHLAKRKADRIIAMNSSVYDVLNLKRSDKVVIIPSVGSEEVNQNFEKSTEGFNVLSIGRFVPLKAFDVTLQSFIKFYKKLPEAERKGVKLTMIGKGPVEGRLQEIIEQEGVQEGVEIIKWMERSKLRTLYEQSHLFFFPTHEGAGMVISEALSYRTPILCFDNCGPGEFITPACGVAVPYSTYEESIEQFAKELDKFYLNKSKWKTLQTAALERHTSYFSWNEKGKQLVKTYEGL